MFPNLTETPRKSLFLKKFSNRKKTMRRGKENMSLLVHTSKCKFSLLAPSLRQQFVLVVWSFFQVALQKNAFVFTLSNAIFLSVGVFSLCQIKRKMKTTPYTKPLPNVLFVDSSHDRSKMSKLSTSTAGGRKSLFAPSTWLRPRVPGARYLFFYLPPNLTSVSKF